MALRETNEAAFFGLMAQDVTGLLPLVYTPTVGKACQDWSRLIPRPTGLYISINDKVRVCILTAICPFRLGGLMDSRFRYFITSLIDCLTMGTQHHRLAGLVKHLRQLHCFSYDGCICLCIHAATS